MTRSELAACVAPARASRGARGVTGVPRPRGSRARGRRREPASKQTGSASRSRLVTGKLRGCLRAASSVTTSAQDFFVVFLALWRPPPAVRSRASTVMANALASALSTAASFARADPSRRHLGVSPSRSGASAFLGRALPCLSRRRPGRKSCEPPRRPAAVLGSREASGLGEQDPDGIVWDTQKYTWRVGGPNDIPCVHLRDVPRGKPLTPIEPVLHQVELPGHHRRPNPAQPQSRVRVGGRPRSAQVHGVRVRE